MVMNAPVLPWQSAVANAARSGDEDALVAAMDGLKREARSSDALKGVAEILRSTRSRRVRNTAALALADSGLLEMSAPIIATLRDEQVAGEAGTLLFALYELGGTLPLDVATHLIAEGSYEARAETLTFFELGRIDRRDEDASRSARARLASLLSSRNPEIAEAAELAVGFLDASD